MKLVSFDGGFGRLDGDAVVPMGRDLETYLVTGVAQEQEPLTEVPAFLAPIPRPGKIIAVGLNYADHARESGQEPPPEPVLFAKFANSIIANGEPIVVPAACQQVDFEAELGVVIGRQARRISQAEALDHVAGYVCVNDVSARDLQFRTSQWIRGKAIDTFLPVGPYLLTADEVGDPQSLSVRCLVNDEVMQDGKTRDQIFGVAELISFISQTLTLEPGDLIATGTPAGVGSGRRPPVFLKDGDVVSVEITGLGRLTNPVRTEVVAD